MRIHFVRGGLLWPFLVFCDPSVFLHDGLWCKVQLLWILPYFVVFVTIMAFMVVQLVAVHFEFVSGDFHTTSWFFSKVWMFGAESDISNIAISISAAILILHCGLQ